MSNFSACPLNRGKSIFSAEVDALMAGVFLGLLGSLFVLMGGNEGTDEIIQVEGESETAIQEILEILHWKARIKNIQ
jgi:hypothetical protein